MHLPDHIAKLLRPGFPVPRWIPDEYDVEAGDIIRPHAEVENPDIILAGIPFDTSVMIRPGCQFGPQGVRQNLVFSSTYEWGLGVDLSSGVTIADVGDVDAVRTSVEETHRRVEEVYTHLFGTGAFVVTIGGDHGLAYPLIKALVNARPGQRIGVISIDAHLDVRHSHHGEMSSGTPFRRVLNIPGSPVRGENVVELGINTWHNTGYYARYVREQGITVIPAREIHKRGIESCIEQCLEVLTRDTDAFYVTFDIDAFDACVAPGTCSPSPGGLTSYQGLEAVFELCRHPKCAGADVMEVAPQLDVGTVTQQIAGSLIMQMFGAAKVRKETLAGAR